MTYNVLKDQLGPPADFNLNLADTDPLTYSLVFEIFNININFYAYFNFRTQDSV